MLTNPIKLLRISGCTPCCDFKCFRNVIRHEYSLSHKWHGYFSFEFRCTDNNPGNGEDVSNELFRLEFEPLSLVLFDLLPLLQLPPYLGGRPRPRFSPPLEPVDPFADGAGDGVDCGAIARAAAVDNVDVTLAGNEHDPYTDVGEVDRLNGVDRSFESEFGVPLAVKADVAFNNPCTDEFSLDEGEAAVIDSDERFRLVIN
ncbi:hypothetical protein DERP_001776 [Dermatophagoides pteronyssinus]|uniref:Uncharacterized protein n=1 Tax=Dermatophagoides pteronyssinus TaxID=6956 RepID=A0ABQ8JC10_DERPT|nr:hypothetical protein DERP_001776 [Dermatophagoides pteronyssinus]